MCPRSKLFRCPIPKCGTTTWTDHMALLSGYSGGWYDAYEELLHKGVPVVDTVIESKNV